VSLRLRHLAHVAAAKLRPHLNAETVTVTTRAAKAAPMMRVAPAS